MALTPKQIRKLKREFGPNFDEMPQDELLRIAASNSYHNGKALKEIRTIVTIIAIAVGYLGARALGWI